jgi:hypothetical protein
MRTQDYLLLKEAYYGDGGFLDGGRIVKHQRERNEKLQARRDICYFLNYVAPVVNSHVGPVFAKPQVRDWKTKDDLISMFMDDVDREETNMEQFMKSAALASKLLGTVYIVVDNLPDDEQPKRKSEAVESRACPYAFLVNPNGLANPVKKRRQEIVEFSYYDGLDDEGNQLVRTWTQTEWKLEVRKKDDEQGTVIESGKHDLGIVPVVVLHSRKVIRMEGVSDGCSPLPSEFLSIARANLRIFNLCSELDEILRNQAFSILAYPSKEPKDLTIGTDNALGYDGEKSRTAPHFIAPPSDPAQLVMSQIDRLIKEIYRMAMLTHAVGVQEASSGIARAWDFEKTNQALTDFASNCEEAEKKVVRIFGRWTKTDIDYQCNYPDDFSITDTMQEIKNALDLLDMNLKAKFAAAVKKRVARVVLADVPTDEYDEVIKEIDEEAEDAAFGDALKAPGVDEIGNMKVGVANGIIELLAKVREKVIAPEAARVVLVALFGLSEQAAEEAVNAQVSEPGTPAPATV